MEEIEKLEGEKRRWGDKEEREGDWEKRRLGDDETP